MLLNNKIKQALDNLMEMKNIRLDTIGMQMLYDEINDSELTIGEFLLLANIFNVQFNCKLVSEVETITFNNLYNKSLAEEIDELYYSLTCRKIHSVRLTYSRLQEIFNDIQMTIIFE